MDNMFKPLGNYVLVLPVDVPDTTPSGIVLPESSKERPNQGKVVSVGNGQVTDRGENIPVQVQENQIVFFNKFSGIEMKFEGVKYLLLRESDLLGYLLDE